MRKVGRPPLYLYEEDRTNTRREQNRNDQRHCRLKKKLHKQAKNITLPINFNKKYQEDIVHSFMNYGFNTLFTGTIDLNHLEQNELEIMNNEIDKLIIIRDNKDNIIEQLEDSEYDNNLFEK